MIHYAIASSEVGKILLAQTHKGVCSVILGDDDNALVSELKKQFIHHQYECSPLAEPALEQLCLLLTHPQSSFEFPLDIQGTEFQKKVWHTLRSIPVGQTLSYKQLAEKIDKPTAIRGVANACGANKLAIIIPCHRVIGSQGQLTGYRWGKDRKQKLLSFEQAVR